MLGTLRKCFDLVGPRYRGRWLLVVLLGPVVSAFEALGALIVFGLLTRITTKRELLDLPPVGKPQQRFPGADESVLVVAVGGLHLMAAFLKLRGRRTTIVNRAPTLHGRGV